MKKLLTTGVVALSMAVGMVAYAAHSFTDVPDDHLFHNEIAWMKDNDITRGCNPPSNTLYCPDDFVTRGQMAAFLYRFSNAMPGGEQGPPGPPGEDGHVGNVLHNSFGADIPANSHGLVAATCAGTDDMVLGAEEGPPGDSVPTYPIGGDAPNGPAEGYIAVGGGMSVGTGSGSVDGVNVSMSRPELTGTPGRAWLIAVHNNNSEEVNVRAWVVCIHAPDDDVTD